MVVLYRKYRPKSFKEIIGQKHIVQTLLNAVTLGIFSHAYLFSGPRGSGKTTTARLLAKAINCQNLKEGEPCNQCSVCAAINENRAIDLIEIDAASNRGIEEIRALKEGVGFSPANFKYKVYIIDESHQLTKEAANALLKTLEEPPLHAVFVLATTEFHKVPSTIVSRCQHFEFKKLTLPEIVSRLEKISQSEGVKIEKQALELLAVNSGGALRDAEGMLEQAITFARGQGADIISANHLRELLGMVEIQLVSRMIDAFFEKDAPKAIELIENLTREGKDIQAFTTACISYLRQALILKINPGIFNPLLSGLTSEQEAIIKKQIAKFSESDIARILEILIETENKQKYASLPQLPLELAAVQITAALKTTRANPVA